VHATAMSYISSIWAFIKANPELSVALALVTAICTVIRFIFGGVAQFLSWLRNILDKLKGRPAIPRRTLRIVPQPNSLYCSSAKWYNKPATSLSGTWYFTNITDRPVSLIAAYIKSPRKARISADSMPEYVLQPHAPQSITIRFFPYPAVHQERKAFKATLVFVDQYDNKHVVKNTLFKPPPHLLFRSE
jgi:hypothetical protein